MFRRLDTTSRRVERTSILRQPMTALLA